MKYSQEEIDTLLENIDLVLKIEGNNIVFYDTNKWYIESLKINQAKNLFKALGKQIINLKFLQKDTICYSCGCRK